MDKLAPAIKWIKKNIFWLSCAFLAIAMVAMWFVASGSIAEETSDFQRDLKSNITAAEGILKVTATELGEGVIVHPNATSEEGMKKELSKTIDAIVDAWTKRQKDQEKILVWPKVIPNETFVKTFGQFNPAETFPEEWEKGYGFEPLLELYRSKIPEQMDYLCGDDVLRTYWKYDPENMTAAALPSTSGYGQDEEEYGDYEDEYGGPEDGFGGGGGFGGFGGQSGGLGSETAGYVDENQYAVIWSDINQDLWHQKLTMFQGRDDHQRETLAPTPLQCYMLQQDLWLLEAMFRIIREVNGNSNANDLSVIKRLDHVLFGREVGVQLGELTAPDLRLAGTSSLGETEFGGDFEMDMYEDMEDMEDMEDYDDMGMGDYEDDMMEGPGGYGGGGGSMTGVTRVPYDNRYVDINFEPLSAEVVKSVITGADLPESNLELIVAKRVPVRIALRMDERRIADFMAACANSPFAFEIQQVRWNKHKPGGESVPLGGTNSSFSGMGGGRRMGMGGKGMEMGGVNLADAEPVEIRTNYDVNVEFYGIVKIYNPVRESFLRKAAGLDDETVDPGDAARTGSPETTGASRP